MVSFDQGYDEGYEQEEKKGKRKGWWRRFIDWITALF